MSRSQVPSQARSHGQGGQRHPIVVIGAGPIGLAAAANAAERGLAFVVLEAGPHARCDGGRVGARAAVLAVVRADRPGRPSTARERRRLDRARRAGVPDRW